MTWPTSTAGRSPSRGDLSLAAAMAPWRRTADGLDASDPGWRERVRAERDERERAAIQEIEAAAERAREAKAAADLGDATDERGIGLAADMLCGRSMGAWMFGPVGTGKTRCARSALRAWLADGRTGAMVGEAALSSELKDALKAPGAWADAMGRHQRVGLLVIDDLGKARASDWWLSALYELVDHRWSHGLPTVVTCNQPPSRWALSMARVAPDGDLPGAIASRLRDRGRLMEFTGPDRRARREEA